MLTTRVDRLGWLRDSEQICGDAWLRRKECKVWQRFQPDGPVLDGPCGRTARKHEPATFDVGYPFITDLGERKEFTMPEMFDWIFFAIVLLPCAFLIWDYIRDH